MANTMRDALLATVKEEHATLEAFASLLTYEGKALAAVSPLEKLPSIIEQKTLLTELLSSLEKQRDAHLRAMGLPSGWKGMELAVAEDARLGQQWKLLQAVVERARRSNTTNGLMIRVRMNYNQSALAVLRGGSRSAAGVYGPDGRMAVA
jgi:flagella synthesis protein FlgN